MAFASLPPQDSGLYPDRPTPPLGCGSSLRWRRDRNHGRQNGLTAQTLIGSW